MSSIAIDCLWGFCEYINPSYSRLRQALQAQLVKVLSKIIVSKL